MNSLINWRGRKPSSFLDITDFFDEFVPSVFSNENIIKPKVEIKENGKELIVKAELPGLTKDDISVELKDSILTLSGERKSEKSEEKNGKVLRSEISYGSFQRSFHISTEIDSDNIEANFEDGILRISLPKIKEKTSKKIMIN